jgi:hypothetical protein
MKPRPRVYKKAEIVPKLVVRRLSHQQLPSGLSPVRWGGNLSSFLRFLGRPRTGIFFFKNLLQFFSFSNCPLGQMKVGMTSSRYGLYKLGYMFATMRISILGL